MQMKTNKNGVKLLAAIMAFAMVLVAGFAIIGNADEADAAFGGNEASIDGNAATAGTIEKGKYTLVSDDAEITVPATDGTATVYVADDKSVTLVGATGSTIVITVYAYNSSNNKAITDDSKVVVNALLGR